MLSSKLVLQALCAKEATISAPSFRLNQWNDPGHCTKEMLEAEKSLCRAILTNDGVTQIAIHTAAINRNNNR